jgi:hypothetical protein
MWGWGEMHVNVSEGGKQLVLAGSVGKLIPLALATPKNSFLFYFIFFIYILYFIFYVFLVVFLDHELVKI